MAIRSESLQSEFGVMVVVVGIEGIHNGSSEAGELTVGEVSSFDSVKTSGVDFGKDDVYFVFVGGREVPEFFELVKGFVEAGTKGAVLEVSLGAEVTSEVPEIIDGFDLGVDFHPCGVC